MYAVNLHAMVRASLTGSAAILIAMYFLLPAMGLPRLDFAAVISGWVRHTGRYARVVGMAVFVVGGLAWGAIYAAWWPWRGMAGGAMYGLVPFGVSCLMVLPQLARFRALVLPMPGFLDVRAEGERAVMANLVMHVIFGACLGLIY